MRRCTFLLLLIKFLSIGCIAQETFSITKPLLQVEGENLIINYDILNNKPGERYSISIEVTDSRGSVINARSLTGDIGNNIDGGKNKRIVWQFKKDNVNDEVNIYIKIIIKRYAERPLSEEIAGTGFFSTRSGLIVQSIALPGLGLSKITNNPNWIMGISGYGLVGSSVAFKSVSNSNYKNFENSSDPQLEDSYYTKYKNQKTISTICAIGAATIWVTDLILVSRASSRSKNLSKGGEKNKLFLVPQYYTVYDIPALGFKYVF